LDSDLPKMMKNLVIVEEDVETEEVIAEVATEDVVIADLVAIVVAGAEAKIGRSSMRMPSQLSEAVVPAKAATKVNNKSLD